MSARVGREGVSYPVVFSKHKLTCWVFFLHAADKPKVYQGVRVKITVKEQLQWYRAREASSKKVKTVTSTLYPESKFKTRSSKSKNNQNQNNKTSALSENHNHNQVTHTRDKTALPSLLFFQKHRMTSFSPPPILSDNSSLLGAPGSVRLNFHWYVLPRGSQSSPACDCRTI